MPPSALTLLLLHLFQSLPSPPPPPLPYPTPGTDPGQTTNMRGTLIRSSSTTVDVGSDPPVTFQLDHLQDWSLCKPGHRQVWNGQCCVCVCRVVGGCVCVLQSTELLHHDTRRIVMNCICIALGWTAPLCTVLCWDVSYYIYDWICALLRFCIRLLKLDTTQIASCTTIGQAGRVG
jgi:hypothetical protein